MSVVLRAAGVMVALVVAFLPIANAPASPTTTAQMWDIVPSADWELRVRSIERQRAPRRWSASGGVPRATEQIALIVVDLTNRSAEVRHPRALDFELRTAAGRRFVNRSAANDALDLAATNGLRPFGSPILPGERATTVLVFDLDPRATRLTLTFAPAPHRDIRLDECHCGLPIPAESIVSVSV